MEEILDSVETILSDFKLTDESVKDKLFKLMESAYSKGYDDGCEWMHTIIDKLMKKC